MKIAALSVALLFGGAALAQADDAAMTAYEGDGAITMPYEVQTDSMAIPVGIEPAATSASAVLPGNAAPERDARGIAVISAPAIVPAGWNGTAAGSAMGGPELDPVTGEPVAPETYPACTATVTDHCLQTYEKGRHRS
jgi:hypothetical protein